jgi:hypothetical protein
MTAEANEDKTSPGRGPRTPQRKIGDGNLQQMDPRPVYTSESEGDDDDEADDDHEDEPKLKYHRLTGNLSSVYRGGDATSSFIISGDKMILGSHNGNVVSYILSQPTIFMLIVLERLVSTFISTSQSLQRSHSYHYFRFYFTFSRSFSNTDSRHFAVPARPSSTPKCLEDS